MSQHQYITMGPGRPKSKRSARTRLRNAIIVLALAAGGILYLWL